MKQSTYSLLDDRDILLNEKIFDEQNNLVNSVDYTLRPKEEKKFYYNDKNQLIREESMIDDRVGDNEEFDYDDDGKIIEQRHNIGGTLYEKTVIEKTDLVETRKVIQDGEETQRVEMEMEGETKIYKFFDYGELAQINTVKKEENKITTISEVIGSDQKFTEVQLFNENGDLIETGEYYGDEDASATFKREYEGENCSKIIFENRAQPHTSYEEIFTHDDHGNRIAYEKLDYTGRLSQFEKIRYNDQNKPVEKAGNNGSSKFHHRIDYDESVTA